MKSLLQILLIGSSFLAFGNPDKFDLDRYNSKPTTISFSNCKDTTICSVASCQESVSLSATASTICPFNNLINYSWSVDLNNDGSQDVFSPIGISTNEFSGTVAVGRHRIIFNAIDKCGNLATCSYLFWVKDCKKPIPVCINGLSAPNMPLQKMVTVWASDWLSSSTSDNCCTTSDLVFRVEKIKTSNGVDVPTTAAVTFDCTELGSQATRVWVGDCGYDENSNGTIEDSERNWDFCDSYILITDNDGICDTNNNGAIYYILPSNESGTPIFGCTFMAREVGETLYLPIKNPFMPGSLQYEVTVSKDNNPLNGINSLDVVTITQHLIGKKALNSPYKKISADVNKDKKISSVDILQIRQLLLYITTEFPNNDSWRFVDKSYTFTTTNEQAEAFPEFIIVDSLLKNKNVEFVGTKIGNVTGSASLYNRGEKSEVRSSDEFFIQTEDIELIAGQEYQIDFKSDNMSNMLAYQMTLGFDTEALDFMKFEGLSSDFNEVNFGLTHLEKGLIPILWTAEDHLPVNENENLFGCRFKAKRSGKLSDFINMDSQLTPSIGFNKAEEGMNLKFEVIRPTDSSKKSFVLNQNTPNPFKGTTSISFNLTEASKATITFYDLSGRILKSINGDFPEGLSTIEIQDTELRGTGIFYYKLETDFNVGVKKMIVLN